MTERTGYYTTVVRESRGALKVGYLFGPFDDEATARGHISRARQLAEGADPFTAFDLFGTASITTDGELPAGVLNAKLEESIDG